jgi:hypothetical protein
VRQTAGTPERASVSSCLARRTGLVSRSSIETALRNAASRRATRSMSAISVPRPGPSSSSVTGEGAPISRQTCRIQAPRISPNIWLTSGAVTKSPARPSGSRVM